MKRTGSSSKQRSPLPFAKAAMPGFGSRREEAEWYESHQDEIAGDFQRAAEAGELRVGVLGGAVEPVRTRPTTLRLLEADIAEARRQARRAGLRYQTYMKMVLHQGLEERRRGQAR